MLSYNYDVIISKGFQFLNYATSYVNENKSILANF